MSLLTNFQDLANVIKQSLDRKADKTDIPTAGQISQGNTGYATGGDVYTVVGNVEAVLAELIGGD